jgi:hypothetical protein
MSYKNPTQLEARCRSLADECERLGTLFALTGRPTEMVAEVRWASQTLSHLADTLDLEGHPTFAHITLDAVNRTRLSAWRAAAAYITKGQKNGNN